MKYKSEKFTVIRTRMIGIEEIGKYTIKSVKILRENGDFLTGVMYLYEGNIEMQKRFFSQTKEPVVLEELRNIANGKRLDGYDAISGRAIFI